MKSKKQNSPTHRVLSEEKWWDVHLFLSSSKSREGQVHEQVLNIPAPGLWASAVEPQPHSGHTTTLADSKKAELRLLSTSLFLPLQWGLDSQLKRRLARLSISCVFNTSPCWSSWFLLGEWPSHWTDLPWPSGSKMKSENYYLNLLGKKRNKCSCGLSLLGH